MYPTSYSIYILKQLVLIFLNTYKKYIKIGHLKGQLSSFFTERSFNNFNMTYKVSILFYI